MHLKSLSLSLPQQQITELVSFFSHLAGTCCSRTHPTHFLAQKFYKLPASNALTTLFNSAYCYCSTSTDENGVGTASSQHLFFFLCCLTQLSLHRLLSRTHTHTMETYTHVLTKNTQLYLVTFPWLPQRLQCLSQPSRPSFSHSSDHLK
jgi:hypothetical protein